jgi:protein-arginine kinase activator protein McsA
MLCEICKKREATVHLTESGLGPDTRHRDLCEDCFPVAGMSKSELDKKVIESFRDEPPDEPEKIR